MPVKTIIILTFSIKANLSQEFEMSCMFLPLYLCTRWNSNKCLMCYVFLSGYYLYIETSGQRYGDRARLGSPLLTGKCTLRMFYHMYGQHVHALVVYLRTTSNGPLRTIKNVTGNVGDNWIRQQVQLSNGNQPYQVVIEG